MKVLVTGGAGFIGSHLVARMVEEGYDVVVLDNFRRGNKLDKDVLKKITLIEGDVRDYDTVFEATRNVDYVFHLAAVLGVDIVADNPVETMETEVVGLHNVARAAIYFGVEKLIYASTSGVYGKSAIEQAVSEDFDVSPKTSYAIAKRYNEIYLASLFEEKNLQSVSLRFFNVYGPKQDNRMVIPRFFEQALSGRPITIYGTGKQTRDFTWIGDVVTATLELAKKARGCGIYNISNESEITIEELAHKIKEITGSDSEITYIVPSKNRYDFEVERRFGSSKKLYEVTGFKPETPLEYGLQKVYEYILSTTIAGAKHQKKLDEAAKAAESQS